MTQTQFYDVVQQARRAALARDAVREAARKELLARETARQRAGAGSSVLTAYRMGYNTSGVHHR